MDNNILSETKLIAAFMGYPFHMDNCHIFQGGPIQGDIAYVGDIYSKTDTVLTFDKRTIPIFYTNDYGKNMCRETSNAIINPNYRYSWNWLMPVIFKCEEKGMIFKYSAGSIEASTENNIVFYHPATILKWNEESEFEIKRNLWLTVIEFIKWHNKYQI